MLAGPALALLLAAATARDAPALDRAVPELDPSIPARVAAALRAPAGGQRAAAATRPLVGVPYLASALGEGAGADADPRFRLDAFDCMTFVETAIALGSASTLAEAARALDDVRYAGAPTLAGRNHEVLSQWIPSNVAKGWIAHAAVAAAGAPVRRETMAFSPESWAAVRAAGRAIAGLPRSRLPSGVFAIDVVAPEDVAAVAAHLPQGTIALVVRADQPARATRITHAGLVVHGPRGEVRVRHATSSKGLGRVIEEPIDRFARREGRAYPRWPLAGLAFYEVRPNGERLRAVARGVRSPVRAAGGEAVGSPTRPPL
ncbi:MAG TPA: N-acetylmuramoyl-L-alanine amidase-like domain-containing protein [Anaeromyxobacter sp.]|nr:N-acetylmuramoyl-L-alanine amidase-like domain-containing protein [Anaeromyxobacter sp.]